MEQEPYPPSSPPSRASSKASSKAIRWSIFSQETDDQFGGPSKQKPPLMEPRLQKNRTSDNTIELWDNELTSLLAGNTPLRTTIGTNRTVSAFSRASLNQLFSKTSSPRRSPRGATPQMPLSSSKPLLLQSMRHWDVALPPIKEHVVGGKLVETFKGALYGNDRKRCLPVEKRKLTIELFGHDQDTKMWGSHKRRNFSDLERFHRGYGSGGSSCGGASCGSGDETFSWELFKGASEDDLSILKDVVDNNFEWDDRRYELAERDIVVIRVMKSRVVTPYDDDFGLGDNSISAGLRDRKWISQSMSDRTMSWMVGLDDGELDKDHGNNASFSAEKNVRWTELSRTRLSHIELVREDLEANEVDLKMGAGARTVVQTFRFDDVNDYGANNKNKHEGNARTFARLFRLLKLLQKERAQRLAAAHRCLLSEAESYKKEGIGDCVLEKALGQDSNSRGNDHISNGNNDGNDFDREDEEKEVDETVSILLEIVSARNLPSAEERASDSDSGLTPNSTMGAVRRENSLLSDPEVPPSSDPYVVIRDGKIDVHATSFIADTVDPIWTLSRGSLCLIQSNLEDFFERSNVLEFTVINHNAMVGSEHQTIGAAMVHKTELLTGNGERKYYQILPPPTPSCLNKEKNLVDKTAGTTTEAPYLCLRYRQASIKDIEFMETFQGAWKQNPDQPVEDGVYATDAFLAPRLHTTPLATGQPDGEDGQSVQHCVKPTPDPNNVPGTKSMTETQIEEVSNDHSTSWAMAGSGSIGKVYIEIIGCDGLKNPGRAPGDKSDPFINIVFEDSIVNTDVIQNCSSPRWMPWSQRAFVLNMIRLSSQVFIGVFDYDGKKGIGGPATAEAYHDPLGRTVINLSRLRSRAIHTLTYNLYDSKDDDNTFRGTITIRLRLAIDDERRALLSELSLRDHCYVSTVKGSDFRCASYSLANNALQQSQSPSLCLQTISNDARELLRYIELSDHITDALVVILFWRGHLPVTLNLCSYAPMRSREITLNLPLHSMLAFAWATVLAWDLEKCFSFVWFAIGWTLLTVLEVQRRHPSPWRRPRSYAEILTTLLFRKNNFGVLGRPPLRRTIHPNERFTEIERFELYKAQNATTMQERTEKSKAKRENEQKLLEEEESMTQQNYSKDRNHPQSNRTDDDTAITNGSTSSDATLLPFETILIPTQKIMREACRQLRIYESVFLWRDSYLAFWITTLCFSISFLSFWIPWALLIQWGFRLIVWPLFGPWMKLVDIHYFQREKNHYRNGEEQVSQSELEILEMLYNRILGQGESSAVSRENILKSKDIKRYMFGKFSTRVPIFQDECFPTEPSIASFSVPYNTNPRPVHISTRIHGQRLKGDMIPQQNYNSIVGQLDIVAKT